MAACWVSATPSVVGGVYVCVCVLVGGDPPRLETQHRATGCGLTVTPTVGERGGERWEMEIGRTAAARTVTFPRRPIHRGWPTRQPHARKAKLSFSEPRRRVSVHQHHVVVSWFRLGDWWRWGAGGRYPKYTRVVQRLPPAASARLLPPRLPVLGGGGENGLVCLGS